MKTRFRIIYRTLRTHVQQQRPQWIASYYHDSDLLRRAAAKAVIASGRIA